jgi:hypothetical protein
VLLHWGQEYQSTPTPWQREVARRLLAAPEVDLILGHHVHVVQPIQRVGSKWVAYGMGNSLSNQTPRCCAAGSQDGVLVKETVAEHAGRLRVHRVGDLCDHLAGDASASSSWLQSTSPINPAFGQVTCHCMAGAAHGVGVASLRHC